ncbi:MAG: hypothetical protein JNK61_11775 [Bacteroidia bacterium]|nr:hypothetical protein [Bacteroidia bacterium]
MMRYFLVWVYCFLSLYSWAQSNIKKQTAEEKCLLLNQIMLDSSNAFKLSAALRLADSLELVAGKANLPCYKIEAYLMQANVFSKRQQFDAAKVSFAKAYTQLHYCNNKLQYANYYRAFALDQSIQNKHQQAVNNYNKAITYLGYNSKQIVVAKVFYKIGYCFYNLQSYDSALINLTNAIAIAKQLSDTTSLFETYRLMAHCYASMGLENKAFEVAQMASYYDNTKISAIQKRSFYYETAFVAICLDSIEVAEKFSALFYNCNKKFDDDFGKQCEAKLKGLICFTKKEFKEALPFLKQAYQLANTAKNHFMPTSDFNNDCIMYSQCLIFCNYPDSAIALLNNYLSTTKLEYGKMLLSQAYYCLVLAYSKKQNFDSVAFYLSRFNASKDLVFTDKHAATIAKTEVSYKILLKDKEIEKLNFTNDIKTLQLKLNNKQLAEADLKNRNQILLISHSEFNRQQINQKLIDNQQALKIKNDALLIEKQNAKLTALNLYQSKQRQWLLLAGIALFTVLAIYSYGRFIKHKKLNIKLDNSLKKLKEMQSLLVASEKEKATEKTRAELSRDLHDDLGATLSSLSVYSMAAKGRLQNNQLTDLPHILDTIGTHAQEMVMHINERVWLLKPENNTIEKTTEQLQNYASNLLLLRNIPFVIDCSHDVSAMKLQTEAQKNVYLIFKEAINNTAKYAQASMVNFIISIADNTIIFKMNDNGVGFDTKSNRVNGTGNGLTNMHYRAKQLNASLKIESVHGYGTHVTLTWDIPQNGDV